MGILNKLKVILILGLLGLTAACGGGQELDLQAGTDVSALPTNLDSYEPDAGSGMPSIPLEDGTERSSSAWDISLATVNGSDYLLQEGSVVEDTSLLIGAGTGTVDSGEGNFAYGMHKLTCEPGTRPLSLNIECTPQSLGEPYFVAVANYTDMRWKWFGPVNLPEFQLELAGLNKQFSTHLGNLYFLILSPEGSVARHDQSTLICGAPDGSELPGCPHHLVASDGQVPDAVRLDWVAGNDNAGFKVFRRAPAADAEWKQIGQTQQTHFLDQNVLDRKLYFYRVSAMNPNGESCFSNVDSGFAGGGAEPGIITGQVTSINGEPLRGIAVGLMGFDERMVRITNQEGKFIYRDLPPGQYLVVPLNKELKFFPPARMADLTTQLHVDMHFNAAPEAIFHRVHGFALAVTLPDSPLPPVLPLEGVAITINPIGNPGVAVTTMTDAMGHYSFEDLPEGIYMVRAHLPGMEFVPEVHEVVVNGSNPPDRRDFFGHPAGEGGAS